MDPEDLRNIASRQLSASTSNAPRTNGPHSQPPFRSSQYNDSAGYTTAPSTATHRTADSSHHPPRSNTHSVFSAGTIGDQHFRREHSYAQEEPRQPSLHPGVGQVIHIPRAVSPGPPSDDDTTIYESPSRPRRYPESSYTGTAPLPSAFDRLNLSGREKSDSQRGDFVRPYRSNADCISQGKGAEIIKNLRQKAKFEQDAMEAAQRADQEREFAKWHLANYGPGPRVAAKAYDPRRSSSAPSAASLASGVDPESEGWDPSGQGRIAYSPYDGYAGSSRPGSVALRQPPVTQRPFAQRPPLSDYSSRGGGHSATGQDYGESFPSHHHRGYQGSQSSFSRN
jgi:hypothetical protein